MGRSREAGRGLQLRLPEQAPDAGASGVCGQTRANLSRQLPASSGRRGGRDEGPVASGRARGRGSPSLVWTVAGSGRGLGREGAGPAP